MPRLWRKTRGLAEDGSRSVRGGVSPALPSRSSSRNIRYITAVERLQEILAEHGGLRDRVVRLGMIPPERAAQLGLMGVAGRASGQPWDQRIQFPQPPYDQIQVRMTTATEGDVAARMAVRFLEIFESLRLQEEILRKLPGGNVRRLSPPVWPGPGWPAASAY